jgi:small-conductance mechanosensitive channel/CRP-like cAMP-binding protein
MHGDVLGVLRTIVVEAHNQGTAWLLVGLVLTRVWLRASRHEPAHRARFQLVLLLTSLHTLLLPATGLSTTFGSGVARDLRLTGSVAGAIAGVFIAGLLLFGLLLPRLRVSVPRIVQDIGLAVFCVVAVFGTASRAGVDLSGIVATGAVLTGVVGLALQDLLGNVFGGLGLQLDHTIRIGDWIRVQEVTGRVVELRWRSTSIETRNWETVIIPNSVLTRTQVTVLGRRTGEACCWRRQLAFSVDFRYPPNKVIDSVLKALHGHAISHVAANPPPDCVLLELGDSSCRYAVRYWLTDLAFDVPTDSVVQTRIYYALRRGDIPLSMPAHAVFLTQDSPERQKHKQDAERDRRVLALSRMGLFRDLSDVERAELADSLHYAPFARGEVLTRQGAEAHHLYMIASGTVSVRTGDQHAEHEIAQLKAGEFFGEMSLLTGAPRSATVVALTEVECFRLDAEAFRRLLKQRPDMAEKVAGALAERRMGLLATREKLSDGRALADITQRDLLDKIRAFFRV